MGKAFPRMARITSTTRAMAATSMEATAPPPTAGMGPKLGNPNYGISGNLYGGYGSTGGDYLGGNIYGNAGYGLPNYDYPSNQFGNGYYPAPQYQGGYIDYSNYPNMNYMQQPYLYPAPPYTDSNFGSAIGF